MRRLPVDITGMTFLCAIAPQEVRDELGRPKADRTTGEVLWQTQVVVLTNDGADVIRVVTAGQAPRVEQSSKVKVTDLVAMPWSLEGRSGVSFRAASIEPAAPQVVPNAKAS